MPAKLYLDSIHHVIMGPFPKQWLDKSHNWFSTWKIFDGVHVDGTPRWLWMIGEPEDLEPISDARFKSICKYYQVELIRQGE